MLLWNNESRYACFTQNLRQLWLLGEGHRTRRRLHRCHFSQREDQHIRHQSIIWNLGDREREHCETKIAGIKSIRKKIKISKEPVTFFNRFWWWFRIFKGMQNTILLSKCDYISLKDLCSLDSNIKLFLNSIILSNIELYAF